MPAKLRIPKPMNTRWKIGLLLLAVIAIGGMLIPRPDHSEQTDAEKTRSALRQRGVKTDLSDFDFSVSQDVRDRCSALTMAGDLPPRRVSILDDFDLMPTVGEHAATVVWHQEKLVRPPRVYYPVPFEHTPAKDDWSRLRDSLEEQRPQLDAAAAAALSGPIRFDLNASAGISMLLAHLPNLRYFVEWFGCRAMVALHDHDENIAWTNLLAATRVVTAWDAEPVEVSQRVRHALIKTVFDVTWQALQAGDWPDNRLAQLQREWESCDLFKDLPTSVAFTGAANVALCRQERLSPAPIARYSLSLRSPRQMLNTVNRYLAEMSYRSHGTYVDEKDMLLFYPEREDEMRRAIRCQTWAEMRGLPGVTNETFFTSRYKNSGSRTLAMMRLRNRVPVFQGARVGLLSSAAEAEARRRIILAAIALERFHARHGSYPKSLADISPEFLKTPPVDFMDGQPLRYSLAGDGHYFLYSVGLDCVDDGGKFPAEWHESYAMQQLKRRRQSPEPSDLVWPRPAMTAAGGETAPAR
jgi:hypothetical protein